MRSIVWLLTTAILLIVTLPLAIVLCFIERHRNPYAHPMAITNFIAGTIIPLLTRLGGCDYEIIGSENIPKDAAVFAGNHQGNFDVLLIQFALGEHKITMTKWEAIYVPIANVWMGLVRCIFVKRKKKTQAGAAMRKTMRYVSNGRSVLYFPEGTRSQGPEMGSFKMGAFKTAIATRTQIVPFVIDGTYKVYEQQHRLKKAKVTFSILPPIMVNGDEDVKELAERTKGLIQKELDRLRGNADDERS